MVYDIVPHRHPVQGEQKFSDRVGNWIYTVYDTVLYIEAETHEIKHGLLEEHKNIVSAVWCGSGINFTCKIDDRSVFVSGGEPRLSLHNHNDARSSHFSALRLDLPWSAETGAIALHQNYLFLCAEPGGRVVWDKAHCDDWERFYIGNPRPPLDRFHIFGDSHSLLYKSLPSAVVHHLGPMTMHRVGRDGFGTEFLESVGIASGDTIGFVFGEIDVRSHVAQQRDRFSRHPDDVIEILVLLFIRRLIEVQDHFADCPLLAFGVVPPAAHNYPNFDNLMPRNGSDEDRVRWTKLLNRRLRRECERAGLGFVDQYEPFKDHAGLLDSNFSNDGVHIKPGLAYTVNFHSAFVSLGDKALLAPTDQPKAEISARVTFDPLIYTACYGSDEYFQCLNAFLISLNEFGKYQNSLLIFSDRAVSETMAFIPDEFRSGVTIVTRDAMNFTQRYAIAPYHVGQHSPILYLDVDIIVTAPIESLLKTIFNQRGVAVCSEGHIYPDLAGQLVHEIVDLRRVGNWFGLDLCRADKSCQQSKFICANSGLFGFCDIGEFSYLGGRIIEEYTSPENQHIAQWFTDQAFYNYILVKYGKSDTSCFKYICKFVDGWDRDLHIDTLLVHFIWTRGEQKIAQMQHLIDHLRATQPGPTLALQSNSSREEVDGL